MKKGGQKIDIEIVKFKPDRNTFNESREGVDKGREVLKLHGMESKYVEAMGKIYELFDDAEAGKEGADISFACLTYECLARFEKLTQKGLSQPVKRFLRTKSNFPVRWSPHPERQQAVEKLWNDLEVSKDNPLMWDNAARWRYSDSTVKVAVNLYDYLVDASHKYQTYCDVNQRLKTNLLNIDSLPNWYKQAGKLTPFNCDTWPDWWACAKEALEYSFPEPQKDPTLRALVTAKTHLATEGKIKARIYEKLRSKFKELAHKKPCLS